jgi:hypothetical protein
VSPVPERVRGRGPGDRGSAVVDFALVGGLLSLLFVSLLQLALVLHVRNVLIDCAAEGARYGARADRTPQDAVQRTVDLVGADLGPGFAGRVASTITADVVDRDGVQTVEVRLRAPLPVVALVGPSGGLSVSGHAFAESQP